MIKRISYLILFIAISSGFGGIAVTPSENIRKIVEDISANVNVSLQGEQFYCLKLLPEFYNKRQFEPAWQRFSKSNFPYTLRQDPGKTNALGQVKFMFPNKFNVDIHDTPSKELFNKAERIFSSGCIRLEHTMSFVEYLLINQADLSMEKVNKMLADGKEHTVILRKPLNVHIQYLTSWVENDIVNFRNDVYERDKAVLNALKEQPSIL